jgi:hypothetical protein
VIFSVGLRFADRGIVRVLPCPLLGKSFTRQQLSRSIVLDIRKQLRGRSTIWPGDQRFTTDVPFTTLRDLIREWARTFHAPADMVLPQALTDRAFDNWRVLISVARRHRTGHGPVDLAAQGHRREALALFHADRPCESGRGHQVSWPRMDVFTFRKDQEGQPREDAEREGN